MADFQQLYALLFHAMTDAIQDLDHQNYGAARDRLAEAQHQAARSAQESVYPYFRQNGQP